MLGSEKPGGVEIQSDPDRDFVVRQIRQMANAIAKLLFGRPSAAEVDEAESALRAAAWDALQVDTDLLDRLTPASAARILISADRVAGYIEVIEIQAKVARAVGNTPRADALTRRAHELRALNAHR